MSDISAIKERPILFSGPMVRAILEGHKTQTRRIVKLRDGADVVVSDGKVWKPARVDYSGYVECLYGQPGDRLWVRESFQPLMADEIPESEWRSCDYKTGKGYKISYPATDGVVEFYNIATDDAFCSRVTPSIHMPRWASRITLEVTAVRVERLQDISEDDSLAEGIETVRVSENDFRYVNYLRSDREQYPKEATCGTAVRSYASLWESINGPGSWELNPWVWVVEFERRP